MKQLMAFCVLIVVCTAACNCRETSKEKDVGHDTTRSKALIVLDTVFMPAAQNEGSKNKNAFEKKLYTLRWSDIKNEYFKFFRNFDTIVIKDRVFYLTEGDLLYSKSEVITQFQQRAYYTKPQINKTQFTVIGYNYDTNDTIKWRKFPIRYSIDKNSFINSGRSYDSIQARMRRATSEWQNVCNVSFEYHPELDGNSSTAMGKVDFVVANSDKVNSFVATSFSPATNKQDHYLYVYRNYWISAYDKTGVFRHELGHILGFRHEQLYNISTVPMSCKNNSATDSDWMDINRRDVGEYDKMSLMHYYCPPDGGNIKFTFSSNDSVSYKIIYPKQ